MNKKLILINAFWVLTISVLSQTPKENIYIPPSANASSLIRQANVQVGYFTGIPSTSIPLYNLPGKKISIPISVDYHAGGIKVQDLSGPVGLGWNLNAGGAITRVVRGVPDGSEELCPDFYWQIRGNYAGTCDGEPDIFYFSFLGRTGKMFLGTDNKMYTIPYSDLKITPAVGANGIGYWIITDETGTSYYFGENSSERENSKYFTGSHTGTMTERLTYTSTWYLNKVLSQSHNTIATLSYSSSPNESYFMYGEKKVNSGSVKRNDVKVTTLSPKYINSITTALGSVSFSFIDSNRNGEDLIEGGRKLNQVSVYNRQNTLINRYQFNISNFICHDASAGLGLPIPSRLKLESIAEGMGVSTILYQFDYLDDVVNDNVSYGLPLRRSFWVDKFGFFNKASNSIARFDIVDGSRESDPTSSKVFLLKQIDYLGGGKTSFEYVNTFNSRNISVQSVSQFNNNVLVARSTFQYIGLAQLVSTPIFSYTFNGNTYKTSNSARDLYDIDGIGSGYSKVIETFLDGSKIEREFTNFTDPGCEDVLSITSKWRLDESNFYYQDTWPSGNVPFTPATSRAPMRGLLKAESVFSNQNAETPIAKTTYTYTMGNDVHDVEGTAVELFTDSEDGRVYVIGKYRTKCFPVFMNESTTYRYDQENNSESRTRHSYSYSLLNKTFPKQVITQLWDFSTSQWGLDQTKVEFKYPSEITENVTVTGTITGTAEGLWLTQFSNVITPIEKLYFSKHGAGSFKIIGGELLTFKRNSPSTEALLYQVLKLDIQEPILSLGTPTSLTSGGTVFSFDGAFRPLQEFTYTQSTANLESITNTSGVTTRYEWSNDYSNSLPTRMYNTIAGVQHGQDITYNTLFGIETITDANNQMTTYEYDRDGRLKLVRDQTNNILMRNRYHIAGENEQAVDFQVTGNPSLGSSLTFKSTIDVETSGSNTYVWDFGNNVIQETPNSTIVYTYPVAGTYTVKLSKVNPEYGAVITSKEVIVYGPLSVFVQGTHLSYNICNPDGTPQFTASVGNGCPGMSYLWEWSLDGTSWTSMGESVGVPFQPIQVGNYSIKCTVLDGCGRTTFFMTTINVVREGSNCIEFEN